MYSNSFLAAATNISSQRTIVNLAKRAFSNVIEGVTSKKLPVKQDYSGK